MTDESLHLDGSCTALTAVYYRHTVCPPHVLVLYINVSYDAGTFWEHTLWRLQS
jgi:hypothetical protein|eukprot:COSAG06_NODE_2472_length_6799_cov_6.088955_8_plen_54_part_00